MSQSSRSQPATSRPPVTFDRMYEMFPPLTSPPARSHPVGYDARVFIPEPTDKDLGLVRAAEVHTIGHDLQDARMMAGLGDLFVPTAALAASVFRADGVPKQHREYMVLRVAKLLNCPHPWSPNVRVAQNTGVAVEEILALEVDGPVTELDEEGNLIVRAIDELTLAGTLSDATLAALRSRYTDEICRKYVLMISWYNLFTRFCNGCRVGVESPAEVVDKIGNRTNPA